MKKYTVLVVLLALMLTLGGLAYGQGRMGGTSGSEGSSGMDMSSDQMRVDINTASAKELEAVPGMSRSIANNIVKYRDQNGPLTSVDDLIKVKGMNQKKLNTMRSHLMVHATGSPLQPMGGSQGGMGTGGEGTGETNDGMGGPGTDMNGSGSGRTGY